MLQTGFGDKLRIIDATHEGSIEKVFGKYVALIQKREAFSTHVTKTLKENGIQLASFYYINFYVFFF